MYDSLDLYKEGFLTEEKLRDILIEEHSIELINLFYRIYYGGVWARKFALEELPEKYKKYEEKIRHDRELYDQYGKVLRYYYFNNRNTLFSLPLYLQEELDQYKIGYRTVSLKHDEDDAMLGRPLFYERSNLYERAK